jgi:hypothetical protein
MEIDNQDSSEIVSHSEDNEKITKLHTLDKIAEIASKNETVALIIACAIGTSIVLYVAAKSAALLITAWH